MLSIVSLSLLLSWVQVSSDTFIVKSSAGEERAKHVLRELENFHQLLGTLVFEASQLPELPMEVLVVGDDETLSELAPEYNGRRIGIAAYYQPGQDRDFIVLSGLVFPRALTSIVYHEITHYFLNRALVHRPTWLNEGLAEYFATATINDDEIFLGGLSPERLQVLRTSSLLRLGEFFAVDPHSSYYNEKLKANVFYAQAWAFVHFLMHSEHAPAFKSYVEALTKGEAELLSHLNVSESQLETSFLHYLNSFIRHSPRKQIKVSRESWTMRVESIPDLEAYMTISEIFLAAGHLDSARRYLEAIDEMYEQYPRASYYRGILARIDGDPSEARDFFVDALLDPQLAARAAVHLVQLGDLHIPAVRASLEEASAAGTRMSEVYWALSEIYLSDLRRIEESARLARLTAVPPPDVSMEYVRPGPVEVIFNRYAGGSDQHIAFQLLSETGLGPTLESFVMPYYPDELRTEKLSGEVVVDLQLTENGDVAGVWLVSATPEIFANLATSAVRQWKFEALAAKIRVLVEFQPE